MILLDKDQANPRTSSATRQISPEGNTTVIILERDGSLRHYPPNPSDEQPGQAQIDLPREQAEATVIDKIIDFTFDILGMNNLELRVYEHQKR